jgi:hypothetical protein
MLSSKSWVYVLPWENGRQSAGFRDRPGWFVKEDETGYQVLKSILSGLTDRSLWWNTCVSLVPKHCQDCVSVYLQIMLKPPSLDILASSSVFHISL